MSDKFTKDELLQLSRFFLLKPENKEERKSIYKKLLKTLHEEEDVYKKGDKQDPITMVKYIMKHIDWGINENEGTDNFFDGIDGVYTSAKEYVESIKNDDLKPYEQSSDKWEDAFWNDSVSNIIEYMCMAIDPEFSEKYENTGLLIENIDTDTIDSEHLKASISKKDGNVALRLVDIINADAGNSFEGMNDVYKYGYFFEKATLTLTPIDGGEKTVFGFQNTLFCGEYLNVFSLIDNAEIISGEQINALISSCERGIIENQKEMPVGNKYYATLTSDTKYVLKIVDKPWVVSWYNIDADTYKKVRDDDIKLSAITNKEQLHFTQSQDNKWIRLIMPKNKRKVEVEDLNRNFWVIGQCLGGIASYLFDSDGVIAKVLKNMLKEITQLWENILYLWSATALLVQKRRYDHFHDEVIILSAGNISFDFKYDDISNTIISSKNSPTIDEETLEKQIENKLDHLINKYSDRSLRILPCIRKDNYNSNYYSQLWYPGLFIYDKNDDEPKWVFKKFDESTEVVFDIKNYFNYLYGIEEKEETYYYMAPIDVSQGTAALDGQRIYGLVRDEVTFGEDEININFYDVAREIVKGENEPLTTYKITIDDDQLQFTSTQPEEIDKDAGSIPITRGYYQGELLSSYVDIQKLPYSLQLLKDIKLKPTTMSDTDFKQFYISNGEKSVALRQEDKKIFETVIKTYVEYNKLTDKNVFWTDNKNRENYFSAPTHFVGIDKEGNPILSSRQEANKTLIPDSEKAIESIDEWKNQVEHYYNSMYPTIDNATILFANGFRICNYSSGEHLTGNVQYYFPYNNELALSDDMTLLHPIMLTSSIKSSYCGAMIAVPKRDNSRVFSFYDYHISVNPPSSDAFESHLVPGEDDEYQHYLLTHDDEQPLDKVSVTDYSTIKSIKAKYYTYKGVKSGSGGQQWLVMLKDGEEEINDTNWLVINADYAYLDGVHLGYEKDGKFISNGNIVKLYPNHTFESQAVIDQQLAQYVGHEYYAGHAEATLGDIIDEIKEKLGDYSEYNESWYIDRAIMSTNEKEYLSTWFVEQNLLYKDNADWEDTIVDLYKSYGYSEEQINSNRITSHGIKVKIDDESDSIDISERLYIVTMSVSVVRVYVFGPDGKYARGYYPRKRDENGTLFFDKVVYEETPLNRNIDDLRKGYHVISNTAEQWNIEKYKSRFSYNEYLDTKTDDPNEYNIIWDPDLIKWDGGVEDDG